SAFECAPVNYEHDFFSLPLVNPDIATNPPFRLAEKFCRRALEVGTRGAMLLPHAFDTAKGRVDLWQPPYKAKYVLTKRIRWENLEQKKAGPSSNHAWYVWDRTGGGLPFMGWI